MRTSHEIIYLCYVYIEMMFAFYGYVDLVSFPLFGITFF